MKKITIRHRKSRYSVGLESDDQSFIDSEIARITAKSQLWKPEREIVEFSESYDESDVLSRREEAVGEGVVSYVTLRAEYVIEEKDLSQDYDWLISECMAKRGKEYPSIQEIAEALMEKFGENRYEKFEALHLKRMEVKNKYPKPVKKGL